MYIKFVSDDNIASRYRPRNCEIAFPAVICWTPLAHKVGSLIGCEEQISQARATTFVNSGVALFVLSKLRRMNFFSWKLEGPIQDQ